MSFVCTEKSPCIVPLFSNFIVFSSILLQDHQSLILQLKFLTFLTWCTHFLIDLLAASTKCFVVLLFALVSASTAFLSSQVGSPALKGLGLRARCQLPSDRRSIGRFGRPLVIRAALSDVTMPALSSTMKEGYKALAIDRFVHITHLRLQRL